MVTAKPGPAPSIAGFGIERVLMTVETSRKPFMAASAGTGARPSFIPTKSGGRGGTAHPRSLVHGKTQIDRVRPLTGGPACFARCERRVTASEPSAERPVPVVALVLLRSTLHLWATTDGAEVVTMKPIRAVGRVSSVSFVGAATYQTVARFPNRVRSSSARLYPARAPIAFTGYVEVTASQIPKVGATIAGETTAALTDEPSFRVTSVVLVRGRRRVVQVYAVRPISDASFTRSAGGVPKTETAKVPSSGSFREKGDPVGSGSRDTRGSTADVGVRVTATTGVDTAKSGALTSVITGDVRDGHSRVASARVRVAWSTRRFGATATALLTVVRVPSIPRFRGSATICRNLPPRIGGASRPSLTPFRHQGAAFIRPSLGVTVVGVSAGGRRRTGSASVTNPRTVTEILEQAALLVQASNGRADGAVAESAQARAGRSLASVAPSARLGGAIVRGVARFRAVQARLVLGFLAVLKSATVLGNPSLRAADVVTAAPCVDIFGGRA